MRQWFSIHQTTDNTGLWYLRREIKLYQPSAWRQFPGHRRGREKLNRAWVNRGDSDWSWGKARSRTWRTEYRRGGIYPDRVLEMYRGVPAFTPRSATCARKWPKARERIIRKQDFDVQSIEGLGEMCVYLYFLNASCVLQMVHQS